MNPCSAKRRGKPFADSASPLAIRRHLRRCVRCRIPQEPALPS
jgi:hypothetical protein